MCIELQGEVLKQITPFQSITKDWNNDNDVYELYGAFFDDQYTFYTAEDIVGLIVNESAKVTNVITL